MNNSVKIIAHTHDALADSLLDYEFKYSYELSEYARSKAAAYFLLHYSGDFLKRRTTDYGKVIIKDNIPYVVKWRDTNHMNECHASARVAVSYRRLQGQNVGFAIPKIIYGGKSPS